MLSVLERKGGGKPDCDSVWTKQKMILSGITAGKKRENTWAKIFK